VSDDSGLPSWMVDQSKQAFGFLVVIVERGLGIDKAREPCLERIDIVVGSDLRAIAGGAVGAIAVIDVGGQLDAVDRRERGRHSGM
jgi:hypothetical protein